MEVKTILIGIDPAFREGGFAICCIEGRDVRFVTFPNFLAFISWLRSDRPEKARVCIENSNLQNTTFALNQIVQGMLKGKYTYDGIMQTVRYTAKLSRDAGKNQAASQYTVDVCRAYFGAENVFEISPKEKGAKVTSHAICAAIAKANGHDFPKKSNQDDRDAYMLAAKLLTIKPKIKIKK